MRQSRSTESKRLKRNTRNDSYVAQITGHEINIRVSSDEENIRLSLRRYITEDFTFVQNGLFKIPPNLQQQQHLDKDKGSLWVHLIRPLRRLTKRGTHPSPLFKINEATLLIVLTEINQNDT